MKSQWLKSCLQSWVGVLFFVLGVHLTAGAAPIATVRTSRGETFIRAKGKTQAVPLTVRKSLFAGDVVGTGPGGKLALLFSDGATVRLNEKSTIEITPPQGAGKSSLFRALGGELWARLRPGNTASTRTVALGVRGTEIFLQVAEGDGTTTMTVIEGEVEFFNPFGRVIVATSQQSTARPGQAPTAPITIQTPGLLIEWTLDLDRASLPREKTFAGMAGDELFNQRNFAGALPIYQTAAQNAPNDENLRERLAWTLLQLDRLDEAETLFRSAPNNAAMLVGLAWLELARARPAEAQRLSTQALALAANDEIKANARVALGASQLRGGQPEMAATTLRAINADSPASSVANGWLALALLAQNDTTGALNASRQAAKTAPNSLTAQSSLATVTLFAGQTGEAARASRRVAALAPDDATGQLILAQSLLARGDADAASNAAARAIALDPQSAQAHYLLGIADAGRRDYRHAQTELREALRLSPNFLPAASALARVFNATARPREAVALLEERLPNDPRGEVEGALGEVLYEQGNYALAATRLRAALQKQPASALLNNTLAQALLYNNQLTEAIVAGRRAVQLAPTIGAYHATLGLAYDFSRLEAQAEREYRTALAFDPQNALALAQLGRKSAGTDLRPIANSFTQAFLYDPALSRLLLRGGVDGEVTPFIGDEDSRGLDLTHRHTENDGGFRAFSEVRVRRDGGERINSDTRLLDAETFLTAIPQPRTNLYATLHHQNTRGGLAGSLALPDADDRQRFWFSEAQIAGRHRLPGGAHIWAGLRSYSTRNDTRDPNLNSFVDPDTANPLPIQRQLFDNRVIVPEVRVDKTTGSDERAGVLTFGLSWANADFDRRREWRVPVGNGIGIGRRVEDDRVWLAYARWTGRLSKKLTLNTQLRASDLNHDRYSFNVIPGQPANLITASLNQTRILPAVLANYQIAPRTTLRLAYNQRETDIASATFAPTETLIATQGAALPFGTPQRLNLTQFDIEHYAGRGFLKLFAFRTTAGNTLVGGNDLLGFGAGLPAPNAPFIALNRWEAKGIGARYEYQIKRGLFATVDFAHRQTLADGVNNAPYEPKNLANAELNYISPRGNKLGLRLRHQGAVFADSPLVVGRPRLSSRNLVDLTIAREPSVRHEVFFSITNLFDRQQFLFNGFPAAGRRIQAGYTHRF
jgi:Flp pilus assembly protein TadD